MPTTGHDVDLNRFWLPAGRSRHLDEHGWLLDPMGHLGTYLNADLMPTESLLRASCSVLLGEPGMGKTHAARRLVAHEQDSTGAQPIQVDLGRFPTEFLLEHRVFNSHSIDTWRAGSHQLSLYLDGFDETASRYPALPELLRFHLESWPLDRLRLRIVCRSAEWRQSTSQMLDELFQQDMITAELMPLRRSDAEALIRPSNAQGLLEAIERASLGPLAARPLTLRLITEGYIPDLGLPSGPAEIYERGLLSMCEEADEERQRPSVRSFAPTHILDFGSDIAALSVLCEKSRILIGPTSQSTSEDLTVNDFARFDSARRPEDAPIAFEAVIRTGLFSGMVSGSLAWAHLTFAHYLAARWMRTKLTIKQIESIVSSTDDRICPQLSHVAGWLVAIAPEEFGRLVTADPESFLLGTDIPGNELREAAVDAILTQAQQGRVFHDYRRQLRGLTHPGLARQLETALSDANSEVRRIAIDIARACKTDAVIARLTALGLDPHIPPPERTAAIMAADDLQGEDRVLDFSSVLTEVFENAFERSELVGAALLASWPQTLTNSAALSALCFHPPANVIGLYSSFANELAGKLTAEDLDAGVEWMRMIGAAADASWSRPLVDAIVYLALTNPQRTNSYEYAAGHVRQLLLEFEPIFDRSARWHLDDKARHRLARDLLSSGERDIAVAIVRFGGDGVRGLLGPADLEWLIGAYPLATGRLRANLQHVIDLTFRIGEPGHLDTVLALPSDHEVITHVLDRWFSPVLIDSEDGRSQRENWAVVNRRSAEHQAQIAHDDAELNEMIESRARRAAGGDLGAYWDACQLITVTPNSRQYGDVWKPDLTDHPRWLSLSPVARENIVTTAAEYLIDGSCDPDEWVGTNLRWFPAEAGFRALVLLRRFQPGVLSTLDPDVWIKWSAIIATWHCFDDDSRQVKHDLVNCALPFAADSLRSWLLTATRAAWRKNTRAYSNDDLTQLWSSYLEEQLCAELELSRQGDARDEIVELLLLQSPAYASRFLLDRLSIDRRQLDADEARWSAVRLLQANPALSWPTFKSLLSDDAAFMESVFLAGPVDRIPLDLDEEDLGELYLWLTAHFPRSDDPYSPGVHVYGPRERVGQWRDSILASISQKGTVASVTTIRHLMAERRQDHWMGRVLVTAEDALRRSSWQPLDIIALGALSASTGSKIVRNAADLSDALLDAFAEIQEVLQGDTPDSAALWDTRSRRPKDEEEISDYLRNRLNERLRDTGTIVNREVQVRRLRGIGERVDLRVDALTNSGADTAITVVGEVKGCWYEDLISPVTDQLLERYMTRIGTSHGLYIIVWFDQESWDPTDWRRQRAARRSREAIDAELAPILDGLSKDGISISVVHLDASR